MESQQALAAAASNADWPERDTCPRCKVAWDAQPAVVLHSLGPASVRRCLHCGSRSTTGEAKPRWVFTCNGCGLPFLTDEPLGREVRECHGCAAGEPRPGVPEPALTAATEAEVRAALAEHWSFVGAAAASSYLDRLAREVARCVRGAPAESRVVLFDDPAVRTLGLPSGIVLVSTGTLDLLENEAEVAFVLAHELAHAATGDAAARIVRLGLHNVSQDDDGAGRHVWVRAAEDLLRAGYGELRERDADVRAFEALEALRYDPVAVLRLLERLQARMEEGDARLADLAASHPTPAERAKRIDQLLHARTASGSVLRINREVFRRAIGRDALAGVPLGADLAERAPEADRQHAGKSPRVRTSFGLVALAVLIALLIFVLGR